jgi:hypothetical protein
MKINLLAVKGVVAAALCLSMPAAKAGETGSCTTNLPGAVCCTGDMGAGKVVAASAQDYTTFNGKPGPSTLAMTLCGFGILLYVKRNRIRGN